MAAVLDGFREAELARLAEIAAALRRGVQIRNRQYLRQVFSNTFVGSEAVDWLVEAQRAASREEAFELCRRLLRDGLVRRVLDAGDFRDAHVFYRFAEDEAPAADLQTSCGGHGPAGPGPEHAWAFAAHTAHNSLVLDLALAQDLEAAAAAEPEAANEVPAALQTLRNRVSAAFEVLDGWDLERRVALEGDAEARVYGRRRPRGDFLRQRVVVSLDGVTPREVVAAMLHFRDRQRLDPLFEAGVILEPTLGARRGAWPKPAETAGGDENTDGQPRPLVASSTGQAGTHSCPPPLRPEELEAVDDWSMLAAAVPPGMAVSRLDDPQILRVRDVMRQAREGGDDGCLFCGEVLATATTPEACECPNCGSACCRACRSKQVFDVAARRPVLVCNHCFAESSRILHPPRLGASIGVVPGPAPAPPFEWAQDHRFQALRNGPGSSAELAAKNTRSLSESSPGRRTDGEDHELLGTEAPASGAAMYSGEAASPRVRFARCRQCGVLVERTVEHLEQHSSTCQETIAALQQTWNSEAETGEATFSLSPDPAGTLAGLPRHQALETCAPRIVYRTLHSPLSLFQKREACVLQDAFLRSDGSAAIYEISVKHPRATGMDAYVTAEILLFAHCARPTDTGCELSVLVQMDPKASVPSWIFGAAYLNAFLLAQRGLRPAPAEPVARLGLASAPGAQETTAEASARPCGIEDFELLAVLGRGGFGTVMQVRHRGSREVYAMKVLRKADVQERHQAERTRTERNILVASQSPFVVRMHYAFQNSRKLYMVMDFCPGGDFYTLMRKHGRLPEAWVRVYAAEIGLALQALHDMDVVYRDLKPENVLLAGDGHLKLTDFGLSRHFETRPPLPEDAGSPSLAGSVTRSFCGTEQYMAPEMLLQRGHSKAVDWWCLGLLVHEMLSGQHPFQGPSLLATLANMCSQEPEMDESVGPAAASFLRLLLEKNPLSRLCASGLGVAEMQKHDFFDGLDWDRLARKDWPAPQVPVLAGEEDTSHFETQFTAETPADSTLRPNELKSPPLDLGSQRRAFLGLFRWGPKERLSPRAQVALDDPFYEEFTFVRPGDTPQDIATVTS